MLLQKYNVSLLFKFVVFLENYNTLIKLFLLYLYTSLSIIHSVFLWKYATFLYLQKFIVLRTVNDTGSFKLSYIFRFVQKFPIQQQI